MPEPPQHDSYGSKDSYGKKSEGKKSYGYGKDGYESEKKSNFYAPPKFYSGRYGLGHFGEDKKGNSKKGYLQAEGIQAEVEKVYDDAGYDRCVMTGTYSISSSANTMLTAAPPPLTCSTSFRKHAGRGLKGKACKWWWQLAMLIAG